MNNQYSQLSTENSKLNTKNSTLIPKLRFKEFDEEWKISSLQSNYEILAGYAFKSSKMSKDSTSKFQIIKMSNVYKGVLNLEKNASYWNDLDPKLNKFILSPNDILITLTGTVNKRDYGYTLKIRKGNCYLLNQRLASFKERQDYSSSNFAEYLLKTERFYFYFFSSSKGGTGNQSNVSIEDLKCIELPHPSLPEQKKIAAFLTSVDDRIEQLKRKKSLLQDYKKGVMSRLFTASNVECGVLSDECQQSKKNNSNLKTHHSKPTTQHSNLTTQHSLRFRQDNGEPYPDWEEKKLEDIYSYITTNSLSRDNLNYESGSVFNIHYGDIHTKFKSYFHLNQEHVPYLNDTAEKLKIKDECYLKEGDIILADASEDYADIGKSIEVIDLDKNKVVAGLHTYILRPDLSQISVGFGAYLMQARPTRLEVMRIAQGTKVLGLPKGYLANIKIFIPSKEEQLKIAKYLESLDTKISQVTQQITQTQTFKRGLLQQMFA